jgi:hypothetical protein
MDPSNFISNSISTGILKIKYFDNNIIKSFTIKNEASASATSNESLTESTNISESISLSLLNEKLDLYKNNFKNVVISEKIINCNRLISPDLSKPNAKYINLYYFAYPYIINNSFIIRTKLPKEDSNYLKLNEFNYATNVSPLIISPNYNVLYFPAVIDLRYLHNTNKSIKLKLPSNIKNIEKYYVLQFIDLFTTNFFYISSQTNTNYITEWEIVSPDFTGTLKDNMIKANSWFILILGRIEVNFRIEGDLQKTIDLEYQFILEAEKQDPNNINLPYTTYMQTNNSKLNMINYYNSFLKIVQWQTYFTDQDLLELKYFERLGIYLNKHPFTKDPIPFIPTSDISFYKEGSLIGQYAVNIGLASNSGDIGNNWTTSANLVGTEGPLRYFNYTIITITYNHYYYIQSFLLHTIITIAYNHYNYIQSLQLYTIITKKGKRRPRL